MRPAPYNDRLLTREWEHGMRPTEINEYLKVQVIGQEEVLRYVSVAIFKHISGEPYGNLLLIGNSGTGKTTVMRAMERLYEEHDEFEQYRVVIIMNANTFATDEGVIDTSASVRPAGGTGPADSRRWTPTTERSALHAARHGLPRRDRQGLRDGRRQGLRHRHQHPAGACSR